MAIGVFDSGIGGLSIHRALSESQPSADLIYLADQKNAPYGERAGEEIVALTQRGCETLFAAGASLVILACNTASAVALRHLQSTWLADLRRTSSRPVNVLGIIVPTIEAATGLTWTEAPAPGSLTVSPDVIGIFCTPATARSRVYEIEIAKRRPDIAVFSEPCPGLAGMIEYGAEDNIIRERITDHVAALKARTGRFPDRAILGCTHYEIVAHLFREALPPRLPLIHQPSSVAAALARYAAQHPEYDTGHSGLRRFLTTGLTQQPSQLVERFYGRPISFESV